MSVSYETAHGRLIVTDYEIILQTDGVNVPITKKVEITKENADDFARIMYETWKRIE